MLFHSSLNTIQISTVTTSATNQLTAMAINRKRTSYLKFSSMTIPTIICRHETTTLYLSSTRIHNLHYKSNHNHWNPNSHQFMQPNKLMSSLPWPVISCHCQQHLIIIILYFPLIIMSNKFTPFKKFTPFFLISCISPKESRKTEMSLNEREKTVF